MLKRLKQQRGEVQENHLKPTVILVHWCRNRKHNSVMASRWSILWIVVSGASVGHTGTDCIGVAASRQNEQNGST